MSQFVTAGRYDLSAIVRDAHRRTKKMRDHGKMIQDRTSYAELFAFYLEQVWITAQHEMRAARCTGATVTVAKAFDNGGSPLWSMR
jgi:hypothetical protein